MQTADRAAVEAFYLRVMRRVCREYRQRGKGREAAAARLERQWAERLAQYTGMEVDEGADELQVEPSFAAIDSELDALLPVVEEQPGAAEGGRDPGLESGAAVFGQQIAHVAPPGLSAPSVFAQMLGAKRSFSQLDGPADDLVHLPEPDHRRRRLGEAAAPSSSIAMSLEPSLLDAVSDEVPFEPTGDLGPVSALSVSQFPLQLSAYYSKFRYRRKLKEYAGNVHAAILTMPTAIGPRDHVDAGHMLWLPPSHDLSLDGLVTVVSRDSGAGTVHVEASDGRAADVPLASTRRLAECIVPKGTVRFVE